MVCVEIQLTKRECDDDMMYCIVGFCTFVGWFVKLKQRVPCGEGFLGSDLARIFPYVF